MILYEQGAPYWHQMRLFNASKAHPGMALHTVETLRDLRPRVTSAAVLRRIDSFINRHDRSTT